MLSRKTMIVLLPLVLIAAGNVSSGQSAAYPQAGQATTPAQAPQKPAVMYPQAGQPAPSAATPTPAATPATAPATTSTAPDAGQAPAPAAVEATAPEGPITLDIAAKTPVAACQAWQAKVAANAPVKGKKTPKLVYAGPTDIMVLTPTPMLDEEGRQRLDPDAKPMFNPAVKQQRDKFGHPLYDDKCRPVFQTAKELGYDEKGKKINPVKEKPPKMTPVSIQHGTFTVDGVVGKAALNYDIADLKYIYLYVPGMGVAVVSNDPWPGAKEQKNAFDNKSLKVSVSDHTLEVASDTKLLVGSKKPESAFVLIDRDFALPSRYPVVGYGTLRAPPYAWPGAKAEKKIEGTLPAPPVPVNLRPVLALQPCPAGFMRTAVKVLPGQVAPPQPCVPIPKVTATTVHGAGGTTGATGSTGAKGASGATGVPAATGRTGATVSVVPAAQ